jgi:hypothetical protein
MTNDTLHTDHERPHDELLNRLVRAAARREHDDLVWPRADAVLAYLDGQANDDQREEIQSTLAHSPAFRRFLIDTAGDVAAITAPDSIDAYDTVSVPRHLRTGQSDRSHTLATRVRGWLSRLFRPPVLAPALAIAAVIAIAIITDPLGIFRPQPQMLAIYQEVDPGRFVSTDTRGDSGEVSPPTAAPSAFEAAVTAMANCVSLDILNDRFEMHPPEHGLRPDAEGRAIVLGLRDETGRDLVELAAQVPSGISSNVEAWIIVPPDMSLWHMAMPSDAFDAQWQTRTTEGTRGCVTFTYRTDDGYRATPCQVFEF